MNMNKILTTTAVLLAVSTQASAGDFFEKKYFRVDIGKSFSKKAGGEYIKSVGNSPNFNIGLGTKLNENLRAEVNFSYKSSFDIKRKFVLGTISKTRF